MCGLRMIGHGGNGNGMVGKFLLGVVLTLVSAVVSATLALVLGLAERVSSVEAKLDLVLKWFFVAGG